jgi:P pilus assembly chaperone PapD
MVKGIGVNYFNLKIIAVFALFVFFTMPTSVGLKVVGAVISTEVAPGESLSNEMNISIEKTENPMDLMVDVMDWKQKLDGTNYASNLSESDPYSAKSFLSVSPKQFHLDPGEFQNVMLTGKIPNDVGSGSRYALISIHSAPMPAGKTESGSSVGIALAINSKVALAIQGSSLIKTGEITDISVDKSVSGNMLNATLMFNNTGNTNYRISVDALLKDKDGNVLANATQPLSTDVLPSAARQIKLDFKTVSELKSGFYEVDATASDDDATVLDTKSTKFEINS